MTTKTDIETQKNTRVHDILFKTHFALLYIFLYSMFRNNWWFMDEPTELETVVSRWLAIAFGISFLGGNLFLLTWNRKGKWDRTHYLSWHVMLATLVSIAALEYLVFTH
jgi:hypothetical protein